MKFFYLIGMLMLQTYYVECVAQETMHKKCIEEESPSIVPFFAMAKAILNDEEAFAREYCLSRFEMTFDETRLSFAREVVFDPGTGSDDIQHGIILFDVVFDSKTRKILRTKNILRP